MSIKKYMKRQNYRKIEYGQYEIFRLYNHEFVSCKLKNYTNIYATENTHIKPKGLHIILKNINDAIKEFKTSDNNFKIILFSYIDGMNTYGAYNAIDNEIYLNEIVCDKERLSIEGLGLGHVERHEIWHLKQAENFKNKYDSITRGNYRNYIIYTRAVAKKYLDSIEVNEDNVGVISEYARSMFFYGRYDETEAEIKAMKGALCLQNFQKKC